MKRKLIIYTHISFLSVAVTVQGKPLRLLELDSTPIRELNQKTENVLTDHHHHIDKLKILNLVANLKSEPSPDDYDKDISVLIENELVINDSCVESKENEAVNSNVVEWIQSIENKTPESTNAISPLSSTKENKSVKVSPVTESNKISNGSLLSKDEMLTLEISCQTKDFEGACNKSQQTTEEEALCDVFEEENASNKTSNKANGNIKQKSIDGIADDLSENKSVKTCGSVASSSECHSSSQYSTLKRKKRNSDGCKPPNVLVYSESNDIRSNVISTIKNILHPDRYTIYELKTEQLKTSFWIDNTTLLIVCGPTSPQIGSILMEYFLCGGKMLCLCSDVLNMVLPIYRTAEVRESELVQFSYGRWQKIQLMHHVFCYHPSPIKKHFSLENDEPFDAQPKPYVH